MTKITRKAETSKCAQLGPDLALFSGVGKRRAKVFIENNTTLNSFWETSKVNNKKESIWENENENSPLQVTIHFVFTGKTLPFLNLNRFDSTNN